MNIGTAHLTGHLYAEQCLCNGTVSVHPSVCPVAAAEKQLFRLTKIGGMFPADSLGV